MEIEELQLLLQIVPNNFPMTPEDIDNLYKELKGENPKK